MSALNIPTAREAIAVQLVRQGCRPEQVEVNTTLSREQILAAVDRDNRNRFGYPGKSVPAPGKPRRVPAPPVDPDAVRAERIRALTGLVTGLREELAVWEAELAEMTGEPLMAVGW